MGNPVCILSNGKQDGRRKMAGNRLAKAVHCIQQSRWTKKISHVLEFALVC